MLKRLVAVSAAAAAMAGLAGAPAAEARREIPWGEEIVIVDGACVQEPCALPIVVRVPAKPHPALPD